MGAGRKTKNFLWGEYGYFLEQHISCKIANDEDCNKFESNTGKITKHSDR